MLLNEDFIKVYEELETINEEFPEENSELMESSQIPGYILNKIDSYITTNCKWINNEVNFEDDGGVNIKYNVYHGADANDERVIDNLGNYAYENDVELAIDVDSEGKFAIVYLEPITI